MGKKGGDHSWLTAVKRAFRSPTKDNEKKAVYFSKKQELEQQDEEKKKKRRRWLFHKPTNKTQQQQGQIEEKMKINSPPPKEDILAPDERYAIAVAAAAESAVKTVQAAAEIIRLSTSRRSHSILVKQQYAAITIQTAFRGYLARRALLALKGFVKLQALVRGQNVRRQAKVTLKCMQALLRVQTRVRDQRARISQDGGRRSMFAESNNLWDSKYLQYIRERKSTYSRDEILMPDPEDWDDLPRTLEDLENILQTRKEAAASAFKSEEALAYAFSQQEQEEETNWLQSCMATKQWESYRRSASSDRKWEGNRSSADKRHPIKTVEVDSFRPSSYLSPIIHQKRPSSNYAASPRHHRAAVSPNLSVQLQPQPLTPSPYKIKPRKVRSASPRFLTDDQKSYSTANTPCLHDKSIHHAIAIAIANCRNSTCENENVLPNYMAATESAKARVGSQSAPRQRPSTPERERTGGSSAKKRLSYPIPNPELYDSYSIASRSFSQRLRSPSFKSVPAGYVGMGLQSDKSCYGDSLGWEMSPFQLLI